VQTLDFFPPIVDDAYASGAIAAANAMSDVYAMGGDVVFALAIVAWPDTLELHTLEDAMRGMADTVREGNAVIAGGHTVIDREPKLGLSVTGRVRPDQLLLKSMLRPGDALYLTKAIGTGLLTTAHKLGDLSAADLAAAVASMTALNRDAGGAAVEAGLHAGTDVTGFSLVGHAYEMAERSRVAVRIRASARMHAERGVDFGGAQRNREHFLRPDRVRLDGIDDATERLLIDPQTSGGILVGVPPPHAAAWDRACAARAVTAWRIGDVTEGSGVAVTA
jgi:selenide,water dikinase